MATCFISRVSSTGSLTDAFCDDPNNIQHNTTPKSATKKFTHLYDALNYSSLTEKVEKIDNCFPCGVCREKCQTKQYINADDEINFDNYIDDNKCILNLCCICENKDEIKRHWKILQ
jgi:hypothetical protein